MGRWWSHLTSSCFLSMCEAVGSIIRITSLSPIDHTCPARNDDARRKGAIKFWEVSTGQSLPLLPNRWEGANDKDSLLRALSASRSSNHVVAQSISFFTRHLLCRLPAGAADVGSERQRHRWSSWRRRPKPRRSRPTKMMRMMQM